MGTPSWLYYLFGLVMLGVAVTCVVLLVDSLRRGRSVGRDVELSHVFMGVAMAGMFVPHWAFWPSAFWELVFAVFLVWFLVGTAQSLQRYGVHLPHAAVHALMALAMLIMYWFPAGAVGGAMSMTMSGHGARIDPGLAFLIAFLLFASAIFTLASPRRGASHFGSHGPAGVQVVTHVAPPDDGSDTMTIVEADESEITRVAADATHVAMCVGMGFMLILML